MGDEAIATKEATTTAELRTIKRRRRRLPSAAWTVSGQATERMSEPGSATLALPFATAVWFDQGGAAKRRAKGKDGLNTPPRKEAEGTNSEAGEADRITEQLAPGQNH